MAAPLRASFSEPVSIFTSFVRKLGEDHHHYHHARLLHGATAECDDLRTALQSQLQTLATFAQSAAREALALTERIGSLTFDVPASAPAATRSHSTTHPTNHCETAAGLAKRTEQFATLVFDTDRARPVGEGVEDVVKRKNRQLWDMFDEKECLQLELETTRAKADDECSRLERTNESLSQEKECLAQSKKALEEDLRKTRIEADAWKSLAENVQEMQETAISAFERCNGLERENIELREAMHAFAEGSTTFTIQQLQKIISSLTEEVAAFKKREGVLKDKESTMREKENHSIIKAMRKQTRELKVRQHTPSPRKMTH
jgi:myosin heavy subunit